MALMLPTTWRNVADHLRLTGNAVNGILDGHTNSSGSVTLTASTAATVVTDLRAGVDSVIGLMPKTANAAAALSTTYISSRGKQTFTITHGVDASSDRDFEYTIFGTGRGS